VGENNSGREKVFRPGEEGEEGAGLSWAKRRWAGWAALARLGGEALGNRILNLFGYRIG
jgi:hypothetical protein